MALIRVKRPEGFSINILRLVDEVQYGKEDLFREGIGILQTEDVFATIATNLKPNTILRHFELGTSQNDRELQNIQLILSYLSTFGVDEEQLFNIGDSLDVNLYFPDALESDPQRIFIAEFDGKNSSGYQYVFIFDKASQTSKLCLYAYIADKSQIFDIIDRWNESGQSDSSPFKPYYTVDIE